MISGTNAIGREKATSAIAIGNSTCTTLAVGEMDAPVSVQKGDVAISAAVTPVALTFISSGVVCSTPVSDVGTERLATPAPIVTALYPAEGFSAVVPVSSGRQEDATVIDAALVPRGVPKGGAVVNVVLTGDSWGATHK